MFSEKDVVIDNLKKFKFHENSETEFRCKCLLFIRDVYNFYINNKKNKTDFHDFIRVNISDSDDNHVIFKSLEDTYGLHISLNMYINLYDSCGVYQLSLDHNPNSYTLGDVKVAYYTTCKNTSPQDILINNLSRSRVNYTKVAAIIENTYANNTDTITPIVRNLINDSQLPHMSHKCLGIKLTPYSDTISKRKFVTIYVTLDIKEYLESYLSLTDSEEYLGVADTAMVKRFLELMIIGVNYLKHNKSAGMVDKWYSETKKYVKVINDAVKNIEFVHSQFPEIHLSTNTRLLYEVEKKKKKSYSSSLIEKIKKYI